MITDEKNAPDFGLADPRCSCLRAPDEECRVHRDPGFLFPGDPGYRWLKLKRRLAWWFFWKPMMHLIPVSWRNVGGRRERLFFWMACGTWEIQDRIMEQTAPGGERN